MSEVKVNKISPRTACGTTTLGDSGDTFVFPAGVTITNNGTQTGFGRTGTVDWQTGDIKTGTFTAADGKGYFINTTSGGVTVNLPAGSAGTIVAFADYTRTFENNALTITPNGSEKIGGAAENAKLKINGQSATFVYVDGTEGWININETQTSVKGEAFLTATGGTITTCGDYKIHTFTGPGTFCVSALAGTPACNAMEYLVVGGGGSGGRGYYGGGGGAGGFRFATPTLNPGTFPGKPLNGPASLTASVQGYPVTVGGGGTAQPCTAKNPGSNSVFSTITSAGGGAGGNRPTGPGAPNVYGEPGGSGGGGATHGPGGTPCNQAGSGNTPPVSPPQGNNGGTYFGGGGGGALAVGASHGGGGPPYGGAGGIGAGLPSGFGANGQPCGSYRYYSGGAGGGGGPGRPSGGTGGGGPGGECGGCGTGTAGTVNTGGGGGGGGGNASLAGAGGSGIVVIRYKFQ